MVCLCIQSSYLYLSYVYARMQRVVGGRRSLLIALTGSRKFIGTVIVGTAIQAVHNRGFFTSLIPLSLLFPIFSFLTLFFFRVFHHFLFSVSPRFLYFHRLEPRSSFTTP